MSLPVNRALITLAPDSANKPLSREQKTFRRLNQDLAKISQQLRNWEITLENIRIKTLKELTPLQNAHLQLRKNLLTQLDTVSMTENLGKADQQTLSRMIIRLAQNLMTEAPDPQLRGIFDRHAGLNDPDLEVDQPEPRPTEKSTGYGESASADRQRSRPNHTRQDAQGQTVQASKTHATLQSVYRRLVSTIHPDREVDPTLQAEKTVLMQRINAAYSEHNLVQLLTLQQELGLATPSSVENQSDTQLQNYNAALKQQLATLQHNIQKIQQQLAGILGISPFSMQSPQSLLQEFRVTLREANGRNTALQQEIKKLSQVTYLKRWIKAAQRELALEDEIDEEFW